MRIENRLTRVNETNGRKFTLSFYRFTPPAKNLLQIAEHNEASLR
jgi:hypothetical protein